MKITVYRSCRPHRHPHSYRTLTCKLVLCSPMRRHAFFMTQLMLSKYAVSASISVDACAPTRKGGIIVLDHRKRMSSARRAHSLCDFFPSRSTQSDRCRLYFPRCMDSACRPYCVLPLRLSLAAKARRFCCMCTARLLGDSPPSLRPSLAFGWQSRLGAVRARPRRDLCKNEPLRRHQSAPLPLRTPSCSQRRRAQTYHAVAARRDP